MKHPRDWLIYLILFVPCASSTTTSSRVSSQNGGIVRCGIAYCGSQAICVMETCRCVSRLAEMPYTIKPPPDIYYCVGICIPGKCPINETCTSRRGKPHICACAYGYQRSQWGQCLDIDECEKQDLCGNNSVCRNTDGNYTCECKEGYRKSEDDTLGCTDLDECSQNATASVEHSSCGSEPQNHNCASINGYRTGSDVNENCVPVYGIIGKQDSDHSTMVYNDEQSKQDGSLHLTVGLAVGITSLVWIVSILVFVFVKRLRNRLIERNQIAPTSHAQNEATSYDTLQLPADSQINLNYASLSAVSPLVQSEAGPVSPDYVEVIE